MSTCGICLSRNHLVAVTADDDGRTSKHRRFLRNDDDRWALLQHLEQTVGLDCELVLPEHLLQLDSIGRFAATRGMLIWIAPERWVHALYTLARGPPARRAALIARLPLVAMFRTHLRQLRAQDHHQLNLL